MKFPKLTRRTSPQNSSIPVDDLGFGDKVARIPGTRLVNDDGSFNVVRRGRSVFAPYQELVEMSWPRFLMLTVMVYAILNLVFALGFVLIGTDSLTGIDSEASFGSRFLSAFFFSVQTFTTVGYGTMAPDGVAANVLASFLALFGWVALAVVTGLFYARFARPTRLILFSDHALIAPYAPTGKSLQFRIANKRDTKLINVNARIVLTWLEITGGEVKRRFAPLQLERDKVPLFPLNWTVVHPISEESPIYNWTKEDFNHRHSELLIMIEGYDESFAQQIHVNNSYTHDEIIWNARFEPMYFEAPASTELHLDRIGRHQVLEEE
ncbi:ion channel [Lewinella sp. W8]|uniref:ion channel n=1 Tax=Lewinella sp. W8 TaxID=2528208 RepID=UPI0010672F27|nr:ion channel [Lewinella sp. W8]MTB53233.1 transporter [Lewinella sp. W8]